MDWINWTYILGCLFNGLDEPDRSTY